MVKLRRINKESLISDNSEKKELVIEEKSQENLFKNWKDPEMHGLICAEIQGLNIDKDKTTDDVLSFIYNECPCSLKFNGYMLNLDRDIFGNISSEQYPVEDKQNLTIPSLIKSIKMVLDKSIEDTKKESLNYGMEEEPMLEKRMDEEDMEEELTDRQILHEVAMERFLEDLSNSAMVALDHDFVCDKENEEDCGEVVVVYLTPSYALNKLSDIQVPIFVRYNPELNSDMLALPAIDSLPDPMVVFNNADLPEDAQSIYDHSVQNYLLNDVGYSDVMDFNVDNTSEAKARVVDFINNLAEDYQNKKSKLNSDMQIAGESMLSESRYFIVPASTNLSSEEKVNKLTPLGYTDLDIAKSDLLDMLENSKYPFGLKILDTHYSSDKEDWTLL